MRIYYGTVDNECNVHALVGGIIHQVGQVAEAKDCNSIQPGSFQSSAQCTDGTRSAISALLLCQSPPQKKYKASSENGKVRATAQRAENRRGPVGVRCVHGPAGFRRDVRLFFQRRFILQMFRNGPNRHFYEERTSAARCSKLHRKYREEQRK